jgi:hypothetical protein
MTLEMAADVPSHASSWSRFDLSTRCCRGAAPQFGEIVGGGRSFQGGVHFVWQIRMIIRR